MQVQVSLIVEIEASAGISEMEQQIQEAGQQAMRQAMKQAIRQWEDEQQECAHCGATQRRLEGTVSRVISTRFGRVQVPRRRFRCLHCGRRSCPATHLFAPLKGGAVTPALQDAALLAGCSWPYRVAARLLAQLSGAQISAEEIRLLTNRHGQQRAVQHQAEAERVCTEVAPPSESLPPSQPPLLVGLDGGWVCSREQRGGMEGKVAVVCAQREDLPLPDFDTTFSWSKRTGPRRPPRQRHRLTQRRYVATFGPAKQLGSLAKAAADALGRDPARSVVVLADGAEWIKQEQSQHFQEATCILEWAHLWREVRHAILAASRAKALPPSTPTSLSVVLLSHVALVRPRRASRARTRTAVYWPAHRGAQTSAGGHQVPATPAPVDRLL